MSGTEHDSRKRGCTPGEEPPPKRHCDVVATALNLEPIWLPSADFDGDQPWRIHRQASAVQSGRHKIRETLEVLGLPIRGARRPPESQPRVYPWNPTASDLLVDNSCTITPKDIELVQGQTGCTSAWALAALRQHRGDVVEAIMDILTLNGKIGLPTPQRRRPHARPRRPHARPRRPHARRRSVVEDDVDQAARAGGGGAPRRAPPRAFSRRRRATRSAGSGRQSPPSRRRT